MNAPIVFLGHQIIIALSSVTSKQNAKVLLINIVLQATHNYQFVAIVQLQQQRHIVVL